MPSLGICPNTERCSKAVAKELIDLYPGIGEVCPECGRRLDPAAAGLQSELPSSPVGFTPPLTPPAEPPPAFSPQFVPKYVPSTGAANRAAAAAPVIQPIAPIAPIAPTEAFDYQPSEASRGLDAFFAQHDGPAEAVAEAGPCAIIADEIAPEVLQSSLPPAETVAEAVADLVPPASDPSARNASWVIKPIEASEPDAPGDTPPEVPKRKPAVYAGIAVSALLALGGSYYAASTGTINVPGIPGFATVSAASALPSAPTFKVCSTTGVSEKLVPDLIRGFLGKSGAVAVDASPQKGTYSAQLPNRTPALIAVSTGDAAQAFANLASGSCQLAVTQEPMPSKARAGKGTIGETVLGLAGVAVVVNPSNPVAQVDLDQLAKIFNGTITNWSQAGGPNVPITLVLPPAGTDESNAFSALALKGANPAPTVKRADSAASVAALVSKSPGAIGVMAINESPQGHVLRIVARDGTPIAASPVNIGLKRYPLTTTVYLYDTSKTADPLAAQFVAYTQSDAGQAIVSNSNFVGRNSF